MTIGFVVKLSKNCRPVMPGIWMSRNNKSTGLFSKYSTASIALRQRLTICRNGTLEMLSSTKSKAKLSSSTAKHFKIVPGISTRFSSDII